ncbi:hypothetical protein [Streptomyces sp. enrichment culture]|uniref:hypothetical protein n=1 Tax=Streptomyces sp. enrichment culture TaxID=1795815 RepID=UPI003F5626B0
MVIPLLVGGAKRLRPDDLPADIEALASCQYRRLSHRNADADLTGLVDDLVELLPELGAAARSNGYRARSALSADDGATDRDGDARLQARAIKHRQRGGIGNLNGDFSGTFVSEPQGPVHTGSGHLYQAREQYLGPRISGDGGNVQFVGENQGGVRQRTDRNGRPVDEER